jgi:hypothetical protein
MCSDVDLALNSRLFEEFLFLSKLFLHFVYSRIIVLLNVYHRLWMILPIIWSVLLSLCIFTYCYCVIYFVLLSVVWFNVQSSFFPNIGPQQFTTTSWLNVVHEYHFQHWDSFNAGTVLTLVQFQRWYSFNAGTVSTLVPKLATSLKAILSL